MSKVCNGCKEEKPVTDYHRKKRSNGKYGLQSYCKDCQRQQTAVWSANTKEARTAYKKAWRDANPERAMSANLKYRYGITYADRQEMLEAQEYRCAICKRHESEVEMKKAYKTALHVDHDHETRAVRALLCYPCNTLLGNCREDISVLEAAIEYIRKYNG